MASMTFSNCFWLTINKHIKQVTLACIKKHPSSTHARKRFVKDTAWVPTRQIWLQLRLVVDSVIYLIERSKQKDVANIVVKTSSLCFWFRMDDLEKCKDACTGTDGHLSTGYMHIPGFTMQFSFLFLFSTSFHWLRSVYLLPNLSSAMALPVLVFDDVIAPAKTAIRRKRMHDDLIHLMCRCFPQEP